jgi:DNA mismatch repair protein MSH4
VNQSVICALSEARGVSPSVGLAFINVSTGEAILSQICDSQFYVKTIHKLQVFAPFRILLVSTACPPNPKSMLYSLIEEHIPNSKLIGITRRYWSETGGLEIVQTTAFREDAEAVKVAIQGNFYATCSLSAVS